MSTGHKCHPYLSATLGLSLSYLLWISMRTVKTPQKVEDPLSLVSCYFWEFTISGIQGREINLSYPKGRTEYI
jgi:hypothetical protein